jgi:uncharacterized protein YprB with RNaseH-like and TPR domain
MSSLKERLGRLKKTADTAVESVAAAVPETEIETLGASWERLGAKMHHNDWGQFIIRRLRYPFDHVHGKYRLGELCGEAGPLSALGAVVKKRGSRKGSGRNSSAAADSRTAVTQTLPPVSHERLLFLDTETTGLGVGAGNVAFMIGIGYYDPDAFVVEQLFIRNPAEEAAMLHHLRERLADRDMLVSYNGKCFDWPVIKNRYILNRQKEGATDPVHFDFLYPSRSLWRNTLPSCRLSAVERERLGLSRIDDVPGSLAPALYFQYLAEGDPTLVSGVFEHNEKDVLTLACLAVHLTRLMGGTVSRERMEPEELFRLALWLDKLGFSEEADEVFRELLSLESEQAADYLLPAADFYKSQGRFGTAVSLWERAIERKRRSRIAPLTPYVELAMYYEHQQKDYDRALLYAEQAFEKARGRISAVRKEGSGAEELEAIRKRVERLRTKRDSARQRRTDGRKPGAAAAKKGGKRYSSEWNAGIWQQTLTFSGEDIRSGERSERRTESL